MLKEYESIKEGLVNVRKGAIVEYKNKEEFYGYQEVVSRLSAIVFRQSSVLLKKVKEIKK